MYIMYCIFFLWMRLRSKVILYPDARFKPLSLKTKVVEILSCQFKMAKLKINLYKKDLKENDNQKQQASIKIHVEKLKKNVVFALIDTVLSL